MLEEFINKHASGLFSIIGVIIGICVPWLIKKREYSLKLWSILLKKRIKAHEKVLGVAIEMRAIIKLEDGNRFPKILCSKETFETWFINFTEQTFKETTWLTTEAKRELNYVQDYLSNLHSALSSINSDLYFQIGITIRKDFINLSNDLEKKSFKFFEKEVHKLKLSSLKKWHKYKTADNVSKRSNFTGPA